MSKLFVKHRYIIKSQVVDTNDCPHLKGFTSTGSEMTAYLLNHHIFQTGRPTFYYWNQSQTGIHLVFQTEEVFSDL